MDNNCSDYIEFASRVSAGTVSSVSTGTTESDTQTLTDAIIKGLREKSLELSEQMLKTYAPLDIVKEHIIPALDTVGKGFENHTVYLPSLLMSAEAAKSAVEPISRVLSSSNQKTEKMTVIMATVKGDIHDIGKNIVCLLLENYGFKVIDLGRDVPAETILEAALEYKAKLVGLSALMTTTVPAMESTIKLLRQKAPHVKIMVGGAVLTEEYATVIGADFYGADAMEAVRYAEKVAI